MNQATGQSLLMAVRAGDKAAVRQCLDAGVDVDSRDHRGCSALHFSAVFSDIGMTKLLLDRNANPNLQNDIGKTPLHVAVSKGKVDIIALLLDRGADGNVQDGNGDTALHHASRHMRQEVVELLVNKNVNLDIQNNTMDTPLSVLVELAMNPQLSGPSKSICHVILTLLLGNGADLNISDRLGLSARKCVFQALHDMMDREDWSVLRSCGDQVLFHHVGWTPHYFDILAAHCSKLSELQVSKKPCADKAHELEHVEEFIQEVENMKRKKIGHNMIYDVFSKFQNPTYIYNRELEEAIKSPDSRKEFPHYTSLLRNTFTRAKRRMMLLSAAMDVFHPPVSRECKLNILTLVRCRDLVNLINCYENIVVTRNVRYHFPWNSIKKCKRLQIYPHF